MTDIQSKIDTLKKAIDSPVTPQGTKALMSQNLEKLQAKLDAIAELQFKANDVMNILRPTIESTYILKDCKGFADMSTTINNEGTEITITIKGESPIIDDEDKKSITDAVLAFKGTKHEIIIQEPPYQGTATVDICSVQTKEEEVTGKVFLILNPSMNV